MIASGTFSLIGIQDAVLIENCYKSTTNNVAPETPTSANEDNAVPQGWSATLISVSASHPYVWESQRKKNGGGWSAWSEPVLKNSWGKQGAKMRMRRWAAGTEYLSGADGEEFYDVVEYKSKLYLCTKKHTAKEGTNDPITSVNGYLGFWESAQEWTFIATQLILAGKVVTDKITADLIDADGIRANNVDLTGKITATSGSFTGEITATRGKIGGFTISSNYIYAESKEGNNNSRMELRPETIDFRSYSSDVDVITKFGATGSGDLAPTLGINIPISISSKIKNPQNSMPNIGLYVKCTGNHVGRDEILAGNHAIYIPNGHICGFRLKARRIGQNTTLSTMDSVIFVITKDITITLPTSGVEDGQIYYIRNHTDGRVYVKGRISNKGYPNSDYKTVWIANGDMNIYIYDAVNNVWIYNYVIRDK